MPPSAPLQHFPGIGRCIYCGADGASTKLKNEHMIAFSLGGQQQFLKASCGKCEKNTRYIDEVCGRTLFGDYRIHAKYPTRRPKERPQRVKISVIDRDEKSFPVDVPPHFAPRVLAFPIFPPPGIIYGKEPKEHFAGVTFYLMHNAMRPGIGVKFTLNDTIFCRMLAKVAHCYALASMRVDLDKYEWLLPALIRAKDLKITHLIRGIPESVGKKPEYDLGWDNIPIQHNVAVGHLTMPPNVWLYVDIQLFSNLGTPIYRVIAGKLNAGT